MHGAMWFRRRSSRWMTKDTRTSASAGQFLQTSEKLRGGEWRRARSKRFAHSDLIQGLRCGFVSVLGCVNFQFAVRAAGHLNVPACVGSSGLGLRSVFHAVGVAIGDDDCGLFMQEPTQVFEPDLHRLGGFTSQDDAFYW